MLNGQASGPGRPKEKTVVARPGDTTAPEETQRGNGSSAAAESASPGASSEAKQFETLRARAALSGVAVHAKHSASGEQVYVACRWSLTKGFASLEHLQAWLDRSGAPT